MESFAENIKAIDAELKALIVDVQAERHAYLRSRHIAKKRAPRATPLFDVVLREVDARERRLESLVRIVRGVERTIDLVRSATPSAAATTSPTAAATSVSVSSINPLSR